MSQIDDDLKLAAAVAVEAEETRTELRWKAKRDDPDRRARVEAQLASIDAAMKRLRSHIGRAVWEPLPTAKDRRLRLASKSLQYQRRQLKKMR